MKRLFKFIKRNILKIISILVVLLFIFKIIVPNIGSIKINWDIVNSITQVLMTIATFAAVLVALEPTRRKVVMHFYMKYYNYADGSLTQSKPHLFITNPSSKIVIIHKIIISANKTAFLNFEPFSIEVMIFDLLSDELDHPMILTTNGEKFITGQPIIIYPNQSLRIALSPHSLQYYFGHYIDEPNDSNKDWKIELKLIDVAGKKFKLKTDITFEEYYDTLISTINDSYR